MSAHRAILLAGGNRGDVAATMERVGELLAARAGRVVAASASYESAPWGFEAEGRFLNRAFVVETALGAEACSTSRSRSSATWAATAWPRLSNGPVRANATPRA